MIRNKITISICIVTLMMVACNNRGAVPDVLLEADSLMEGHPDSALSILRHVEPNNDWRKHDRMLHALLLSQAEDKCCMMSGGPKDRFNRTSDSTMLVVADYFKGDRNPRLRALAWFELGRISSDMELTGQAIDAYRRAFDTDTLSTDSSLVSIRAMAADWMGHTLMYQDLYGDAMPHFQKAVGLAKQCGDTKTEYFALRDVARCYMTQGNLQDGERCYIQASQMALAHQDTTMFQNVQMELSDLYASTEEYDKMKACLDACMGYAGRDLGIVYNQLAGYYLATGRADSASTYLRKVIYDENPYVRRDATLNMADLQAGRGDFREAYELLAKSIAEDDSLTMVEQGQNANLIRTLTDKLEREKAQDSRLRRQNNIIFSLTLLLITILLFSYFTIRHKNLQNRIQREKAERLMEELRKAQQTNRPKREQDARTFAESEIYMAFHDPNFTPTLQDYHRLEDALEQTYDGCISKIRNLHEGIKEKELHLCMLEKAEVPNKLICYYLGMEANALSMLRARLYTKLFKQKGSVDKFKEFIKAL